MVNLLGNTRGEAKGCLTAEEAAETGNTGMGKGCNRATMSEERHGMPLGVCEESPQPHCLVKLPPNGGKA